MILGLGWHLEPQILMMLNHLPTEARKILRLAVTSSAFSAPLELMRSISNFTYLYVESRKLLLLPQKHDLAIRLICQIPL